MFGTVKFYYVLITVLYIKMQICTGEVESPFLALYSPGEPEYAEVLVHRIGDNLTLVCELKGDPSPRVFVWNYVNDNGTDGGRTFTVEPSGPTLNSTLRRHSLQVSDSGQYMCSVPPFSVTKYILVQPKETSKCARGALSCGKRCVLASYVCDGRQDCLNSEDELPPLCGPLPCARVDRLNCSSGRCVPEAACCRLDARSDPLCLQPACCNEHQRYARLPGYVEVEYPSLFEDRHAPDDYGFIQSTIYTVTACALIFMVAVVLLVSALCKMHMKRAALRGYALAHRRARDHYAARYPPRYEATSLLEPGAPPVIHQLQEDSAVGSPVLSPDSDGPHTPVAGFGLARLSHIFSRYRQVPTSVCDVELRSVRGPAPGSAGGSPARPAPHPDLYLGPPALSPARPRPLTLQLGRFQLSLPRLRPRPDTPDVDDLDLVRLATDTYTLNGRTIHLLGADFENYPALDNRPPPYNEAMRYKMYGPPPEYLSREGIDRSASYSTTESEARNNVEMPPGYDELAARSVDRDNNNADAAGPAPAPAPPEPTDSCNNNTAQDSPVSPPDVGEAVDNSDIVASSNDNDRHPAARDAPESIHSVMESLPAIDSDINANDTRYVLGE